MWGMQVVEVFVHDPIYSWSCITPKNVQKDLEAGQVTRWAGDILSAAWQIG